MQKDVLCTALAERLSLYISAGSVHACRCVYLTHEVAVDSTCNLSRVFVMNCGLHMAKHRQ